MDSDRTSSASPRESTLSRSPTPASSQTDGGVASPEPLAADTPAIDRQGEEDTEQYDYFTLCSHCFKLLT